MCFWFFVEQDFEWPLESPLDPSEFIEIEVYNFNKIFNNRLVSLLNSTNKNYHTVLHASHPIFLTTSLYLHDYSPVRKVESYCTFCVIKLVCSGSSHPSLPKCPNLTPLPLSLKKNAQLNPPPPSPLPLKKNASFLLSAKSNHFLWVP